MWVHGGGEITESHGAGVEGFEGEKDEGREVGGEVRGEGVGGVGRQGCGVVVRWGTGALFGHDGLEVGEGAGGVPCG